MTTRPGRVASTRTGMAAGGPRHRLIAGFAIGLTLATGVLLARQAPPVAGAKPQTGVPKQAKKAAKLAEPWPDATTLARQRVETENRRLFQSVDTLPFRIKADFKAINRDRDPASTKVHPGELSFTEDGRSVSIPIELRARGVLRRQARICDQVPLRIDFARDERSTEKGTPFDGQKELKLVTHCRDDDEYEQFVLREYLAYKAFNLITPRSLRARLARGTYVDAQSGKTLTTRYAFFLENEGDLARRMGARVAVIQKTRFADYDLETLTVMSVFQFMIGNTDYSLFGLHNIFILETEDNTLYPMSYDYDVSGLVNPPYAVPDRHFALQSLVERLYRGPCRTAAELEPTLAKFRAQKADILRLCERQQGLTSRSVDQIRDFLGDFFSLVDSPSRVKHKLVDTCNKETA